MLCVARCGDLVLSPGRALDLSTDVADRQPEQLDDRVIVGEVAAVLG